MSNDSNAHPTFFGLHPTDGIADHLGRVAFQAAVCFALDEGLHLGRRSMCMVMSASYGRYPSNAHDVDMSQDKAACPAVRPAKRPMARSSLTAMRGCGAKKPDADRCRRSVADLSRPSEARRGRATRFSLRV